MLTPTRQISYRRWVEYPRHGRDEFLTSFEDLQKESTKAPNETFIPFGNGFSIADQSINSEGRLVATRHHQGVTSFDKQNGIISCKAGTTLSELLQHITPEGWFLPVTPSTSRITVGGAVANDVHGRNHVQQGAFGNHVLEIELLRNGSMITCSRTENPELFHTTIGGIGLTGLICHVKIRLKKVASSWMQQSLSFFQTFDDCLDQLHELASKHEYVTAWFDGINGPAFQKGYIQSARFVPCDDQNSFSHSEPIRIPYRTLRWLINPFTMGLFNRLHLFLRRIKRKTEIIPYQKALFQMDRIEDYPRLYLKGFGHFQFALPIESHKEVFKVFQTCKDAGVKPFVAIAKPFGNIAPEGHISFPMHGTTFALDLNFSDLEKIHGKLERLVLELGGRIYLAKDVMMSSSTFHSMYSMHEVVEQMRDNVLMSDQWRRMYLK